MTIDRASVEEALRAAEQAIEAGTNEWLGAPLDPKHYAELARELQRLWRVEEALKQACDAALAHAEHLRMDTPEDEDVRLKLVQTLRLALGFSAALAPDVED